MRFPITPWTTTISRCWRNGSRWTTTLRRRRDRRRARGTSPSTWAVRAELRMARHAVLCARAPSLIAPARAPADDAGPSQGGRRKPVVYTKAQRQHAELQHRCHALTLLAAGAVHDAAASDPGVQVGLCRRLPCRLPPRHLQHPDACAPPCRYQQRCRGAWACCRPATRLPPSKKDVGARLQAAVLSLLDPRVAARAGADAPASGPRDLGWLCAVTTWFKTSFRPVAQVGCAGVLGTAAGQGAAPSHPQPRDDPALT